MKLTIEDKIHEIEVSKLKPNRPEYIILHRTMFFEEFDDVRDCHIKEGWLGVGYHLLVSKSNKVYQARPFDKEGAHARDFNQKSIGICFYINEDWSFDEEKVPIGKELIRTVDEQYPGLKIISHSHAQLVFFNRLLRDYQLKKRFKEDPKASDEEVFQKFKAEIESYTNRLKHPKNAELKKQLQNFKKCPGEILNYLI